MQVPLIFVISLVVALAAFVATAFGLGATLSVVDASLVAPLSVAVVVFLLAFYLSAKRARNAPRRQIGDEASGERGQLTHASATASNRQSTNNPSA